MNLITLGCSWTYGVGLKYEEGMSFKEYNKNIQDDILCRGEDAEIYSFRARLAKKYNLNPVKNFSLIASSNDRQFRKAEEYFTSDKDLSNTLILWGITSTARYEVYVSHNKKYQKIMLNAPYTLEEIRKDPVARYATNVRNYFYDHAHEVKRLYNRMCHWNEYFALKKAKVIWFDTLNTHKYEKPIDNMFDANENSRDLLSKLAKYNQQDKYHFSLLSAWEDCNRIKKLKKMGLVNPHSGHPTKEGHKILCDILSPSVEKCLS